MITLELVDAFLRTAGGPDTRRRVLPYAVRMWYEDQEYRNNAPVTRRKGSEMLSGRHAEIAARLAPGALAAGTDDTPVPLPPTGAP